MLKSLNELIKGIGYTIRNIIYWLSKTELYGEYFSLQRELINDLKEASSKILSITIKMPNRLYISMVKSLISSIGKMSEIISVEDIDESKLNEIKHEVKNIKDQVHRLYLQVTKDNIIGVLILLSIPIIYIATIVYVHGGIDLRIIPLIILLLASMLSIEDIKIYSIYLCLGGIYSLIVYGIMYISTGDIVSLLMVPSSIILILITFIVYGSWRALEIRAINLLADKLSRIISLVRSLIGKEKTIVLKPTKKMPDAKALYNELASRYKEIYGEQGEEILKFRIRTLVDQGISFSEALRKIKEELE